MTEFKSGEQLTAQRLNEAFAEAMSDRSPRDYGSSVGSDANRIRVRLDYPYRAPMGAVVGIDFPIRSQTIEDTADVLRFLKEDTIYSCSKNQYRHHNRIAILEQPLLPGQIGWAVISGLAKTFWHVAWPPYTSSRFAAEQLFHSTEENLPPQSTNAAIDEYRQLAILSADYISPEATEYGKRGSEHYIENSLWHNRERPWWLAPRPRPYAVTESGSNIDDASQLRYPFGESDEDSYDEQYLQGTTQPYMASSYGRVMGLSGYVVPDVSCAGTSTVTCRNARWTVSQTTCSIGCSSWHLIERGATAESLGLELPCIENDTVEVPCSPDVPVVDFTAINTSEDNDIIYTSPVGAWDYYYKIYHDYAANWIVGNVILGTSSKHGIVDDESTIYDNGIVSERTIGELRHSPLTFIDPINDLSGDVRIIPDAKWGEILRGCANLSCTYTCDGSSWQLARGETPYYLDDRWRCKCPNEWMSQMSDMDLPCTPNSQPREYTVGMVYSHTDMIGACCDVANSSCTRGSREDCIDAGNIWRGYGTYCESGTCEKGACCEFDPIHNYYTCSIVRESDCGGTYKGDGTFCSPDPCNMTGACCVGGIDSGDCRDITRPECLTLNGHFFGEGSQCVSGITCFPTGACCTPQNIGGPAAGGSCSVTQAANCTGSSTYLGDGTTCTPDPCNAACCMPTDIFQQCYDWYIYTTNSCMANGGIDLGIGTNCASDEALSCPPDEFGACCLPANVIHPFGSCAITTEADCNNYPGDSDYPQGTVGVYQGHGTTCAPDPCGGSTSTTTTTSSTTSTTSPPTSTTSSSTSTSESSSTTSSTTTTTDGSTSTTSSTTTTTQACGGNCLWGCTDNAWHILTNNCIAGVNCECVSPVSACTTGDQQVTNCAEDGGGETSTTTSSTTTTTEPGSSSTSTTSSTTTTSEGSSTSTTSSTTTTSEAGSSSTTSSTTTTTAFCTGTCDWLCVDSAWQLSASSCYGGEACDCYSFDLESCSGTGATTSNNCRII